MHRHKGPQQNKLNRTVYFDAAPNLLFRALHSGLLLLAAAGVLFLPGRLVPPGLVFAILAVWLHAAARVIGLAGGGKARLFLEGLPFFALAVVHLGQPEVLPALLIVACGAVAGAALLATEWLVVGNAPTFTSSLGFIGSCGLAGVGLAALPAGLFLGLAILSLTLAGYGVARRVRG